MAGNFLLIPVLTQIVGSMLWGPLDRLAAGHKLPVPVGAGANAGALSLSRARGGRLTPFMPVAWSAAFPTRSGRGLTGPRHGLHERHVLVQAVSGFVIGLFPTASDGAYALDAYRRVLGLQAALILLGCLAYFGSHGAAQGRRSPAPGA